MPGVLPGLGEFLQVRTVCKNADQISINVFHYRVLTSTSIPARLEAYPGAFDVVFSPMYALIMAPSAVYRGCGVKNITPVPTTEFISTAHATIGTLGGTEIPQQVSYVVNFKTPFSGRGYRGRCYPGFPPTSAVDSVGGMSPAGITSIQLWAAGMPITLTVNDAGNTSTVQLVIMHRQRNKLPLPFGDFSFVQSATARKLWGTQRRRGDFGRPNEVPVGF